MKDAMKNLCPFFVLWKKKFTVAINPIPVKIFEPEWSNGLEMTINEILTTPSCFLWDSQVYLPTCLFIEEGLDQ